MKILILGITGMLGSCLYKYFFNLDEFEVIGALRDENKKIFFSENSTSKIEIFNSYENFEMLDYFVKDKKVDYIINCLGVIKQKINQSKPEQSIFINSYLPHLLDKLAQKYKSKLIHFSTDCVFDGDAGSYKESNIPLPKDLYGLSKLLGEQNTKNSLTLRTSIIGHEIESSFSLVNWFLSQNKVVRGYTKAIYSGFPTVEICRIIHKFIFTNKSLVGIYNLSSKAISKYELLKIISQIYNHEIDIIPDEKIIIDRSLDSSLFNSKTNYICPSWNKLIQDMYDFHKKNGYLE